MEVRKYLETLDSLYARGDLGEAERMLDGWLKEARESGNFGAMLTFYNEMEGLYRTTGRAGKAAEFSDEALHLIAQMGLEQTIHHGTTLLNGATANRVAGNLGKALNMYQEAAHIFEKLGHSTSYQMGSLYNNISHIYQVQGQHEKALESLDKAFGLVSGMANNDAELATTRVCMSLSYMALGQLEEAGELLNKALVYYESPMGQTDGHYGSALSAAGELAWRQGDYDEAIRHLEKAQDVTLKRFGENDGCRIIRKNLEMIREKREYNQFLQNKNT